MVTFSKLFLVLSCAMAVTSCGGSQSSPAPQPTNFPTSSAADGLAGTLDQPFAQRVAQTPYPTSSLLKDPEAMKRILGPDLDQNGIRDDVDALIDTLTTDPIERKAYQQYAKSLQKRLLAGTKAEAYASGDQLTYALKCWTNLESVITNQNDRIKKARENIAQLRKIERLTLNTLERTFRADEVDLLSHGHTFSFGPDDDTQQWCE
jgi:hypothetical protein